MLPIQRILLLVVLFIAPITMAMIDAQPTLGGLYLPLIIGPIATVETTPTAEPTPTATAQPTPTAIVQPTPAPTQVPSGPCPCDRDALNCSHFRRQGDAQACMDWCVSLGRGDIHNLDGDANGKACESLPKGFSVVQP